MLQTHISHLVSSREFKCYPSFSDVNLKNIARPGTRIEQRQFLVGEFRNTFHYLWAGIVCRLLLPLGGEDGCGDVEMRRIYLAGNEEADPVGLLNIVL